MLFHTTTFLFFFLILLAILLLLKSNKQNKVVYLVASYIFYMAWNPAFILLILASTVVDFYFGKKVFVSKSRASKKRYLIFSVIFNLGLLGFFKYFHFFEQNLLFIFRLFGYEPNWVDINIILPVGISFYTFQTMSYTIDIYRGKLKPVSSFLDFAVFVSFFPQLVAGPIIRASDFLPQLKTKRKIQFKREYLLLILKGLFKKAVIADQLGVFVDAVYANPAPYPSSIIWLATIAFSIQIYSDFSGYTDMAIGIANILGFKFPLNFNKPYFAKTPSDFWRRWHISLSSWLRDYLYIPLGGNRGGTLLTYRNLMLTMLIGGLWHGPSWNFVVWGFLHGIILIAFRYFNIDKFLKEKKSALWTWASWLFMQIWVLITWIAFRQTNFQDMIVTMKKFVLFDFDFSLQNIGLGRLGVFSTIFIVALFWFLHVYSYKVGGIENSWKNWPMLKLAIVLFGVGVILFFLWPTREVPFIYFQF